MKKTGLITAVLAVLLLLPSCGQDTQNTTEPTSSSAGTDTRQETSGTESAAAVSLSKILTQIKDSATLPDMMDYSESDMKTQLGITTDDYAEAVCYVSNDGYYPDFILIAKAKDSAAAEKIESKLGNYRSAKINEWDGYLPDVPERFEAIERSKVVKKDDYVYLVISTEDADINAVISEKLG